MWRCAIERGRAALTSWPLAALRSSSAWRSSSANCDQRDDQREHDRAEEQPDRTERGDAAEHADEHSQRADRRASGDQHRPHDVVDERDQQRAPQHHEGCGAPATLRSEHDRCRNPDQRRSAERQQRRERGDHAEHQRGRQADDEERDADQRALDQRSQTGAVDERARDCREMIEQLRSSVAATSGSARAAPRPFRRRRG